MRDCCAECRKVKNHIIFIYFLIFITFTANITSFYWLNSKLESQSTLLEDEGSINNIINNQSNNLHLPGYYLNYNDQQIKSSKWSTKRMKRSNHDEYDAKKEKDDEESKRWLKSFVVLPVSGI